MATNLGKALITAEGMKRGSSGAEIAAVQSFLTYFGYANLPNVGNLVEGEFDISLENALKRYQNFFSLDETGILDINTIQVMIQPRCGYPDFPTPANKMTSFETTSSSWATLPVSYSIVSLSTQMSAQESIKAIQNAFALWENNCGVSFNEVRTDGNILISFGKSDHGCPYPFDGPGGTLAHAYAPPPNGGDFPGDAHFDEDESWSVNIPMQHGQIDFETQAAHEFGHSIGLNHSQVRTALMFPNYLGPHRHLDVDDINRAIALYGS